MNTTNFNCKMYENATIKTRCSEQCDACKTHDKLSKEREKTKNNKVNVYTCGCGFDTVIKHRDMGVTPMFLDCLSCGERAISHMYKVPQDLEHNLVAFKPADKSEWNLYRKYLKDYYKDKPEIVDAKLLNSMIDATKQHIDRGGVIFVPSKMMSI